MRREHGLAADVVEAPVHVGAIGVDTARQLQRSQRGVTFVHVEVFDSAVADGLDDPHGADPQHDLLGQTVALVSGIKPSTERPVERMVFGELGIEEQETGTLCPAAPSTS